MRKHVHQIKLSASPENVFELLITPSAIRGWWGASRAIVLAKEGGVWAAVWGDQEDIPDYVTIFKIQAFEPPHRLLLTDTRYFAKSGPLPFNAEMTTEFTIEPANGGATLQVTQDGFPDDQVADEFYAACEKGWRDTFASIEKYLASH